MGTLFHDKLDIMLGLVAIHGDTDFKKIRCNFNKKLHISTNFSDCASKPDQSFMI